MIKKVLYIFLLNILFSLNFAFWATAPDVNCIWLPWCNQSSITSPNDWIVSTDVDKEVWMNLILKFTSIFIQFVSVFAVFSLIFSWVLYMISSWDEEKTNKAKKWIIWSLVWVFLSISAYGIINLLNNITIG